MHRLPATDSERKSVLRRQGKQTNTHTRRERTRERTSGVFQQPWCGRSGSERSTSLVMVLVTEGGVAEEARAALGGARGEGHGLQHCGDREGQRERQPETQDSVRRSSGLSWLMFPQNNSNHNDCHRRLVHIVEHILN